MHVSHCRHRQSFKLLGEVSSVLYVVDLGDKLLLKALRGVQLLVSLADKHLEIVVCFFDLTDVHFLQLLNETRQLTKAI